ncbi:LacI family DNA-binding transcriptional regulator [Agromyces albus]|uniref:LacI family transcriptional regulator n=1 Tax=Agromyces albus TaxID=205332 RepID=A0A4Q2KV08_9MICO|nr:LacI family DNA-binding transcriptional regulator [Agromyces albus]RXZ69388.1 LacI family transcriptional regulator [Agromyces albus]
MTSLHSADVEASVGLCLHQPRRRVPMEPFWQRFITGAEEALAARGHRLLMKVVASLDDEVRVHARWHEEARVRGVIVADLTPADPRLDSLSQLGLPAVALARAEDAPGFSTFTDDNVEIVDRVVAHFAERGHRHLARVTGPAMYVHTQLRDEAFARACEALRIRHERVEADFTSDGGAAATRELLARADAPSGILFDNDVMALAGLEVCRELEQAVPERMAIVAWDDSVALQLASPTVTALAHDLTRYGRGATELLLDTIADGRVRTGRAEPPRLVVREST